MLQFKPVAPPTNPLNLRLFCMKRLLQLNARRWRATSLPVLTSPLVDPLSSVLSGRTLCWRPEGLGEVPACKMVGMGWGTAAGCILVLADGMMCSP